MAATGDDEDSEAEANVRRYRRSKRPEPMVVDLDPADFVDKHASRARPVVVADDDDDDETVGSEEHSEAASIGRESSDGEVPSDGEPSDL